MRGPVIRTACCAMLYIWLLSWGTASGQDPPRDRTVVLTMPVYRSVGQLWVGEDGQLAGVRLQLLDLLNRELKPHGIRLEYRLTRQGELPIRRCVRELARGTYQAYLGLGITEERKALGIRFSREPLYTVPNVVWMMKDRAFPVTTLASLKGKRVGVLAGGSVLADSGPETGMIVDRTASTPRQNLMKLVHGRLDAIVDPLTRTGTAVLEAGLEDQIVFCLYCLPASQAHIGYSPTVPDTIRKAIDAAIGRLTISGEIQHLLVGRILERIRKGQLDGR